MTVEINPRSFAGAAFVESYEHDPFARSKKTVDGPVCPADHATEPRSIDPIQGSVGASSASITLVPARHYRLVSSTNAYIRFARGSATAAVGDIYLPANVPMTILTDRWNTVAFIQVSAAGIIQAVELA